MFNRSGLNQSAPATSIGQGRLFVSASATVATGDPQPDGYACAVIGKFKSLSRRLRRTRRIRKVGDWLVIHQYRFGSDGGVADRLIAWLLTHDLPTKGMRGRSVASLVDLFFGIAELSGVQRFVEAGAKDAWASVRAAEQLGLPEVVAFEANPYTFERFRHEVEASGVRYEHLALSEESGDIEFLVRLSEHGKPIPDGQGSLLVRPDHEPGYETVTVRSVRLDDEFPDPGTRRTAMWVDVEGATSTVLRGARALLAATDLVMIEVEERAAWDGQEWLHRDVVKFLARHGLVPIARDRQSRRQCNIVFVRSSLADDPGVVELIERWSRRIRRLDGPCIS